MVNKAGIHYKADITHLTEHPWEAAQDRNSQLTFEQNYLLDVAHLGFDGISKL